MRATMAILAGALVMMVGILGFLWIGTVHRDRCLKAGNVGCSIVPWSGHPPAKLFGPTGYMLP